ncbi:MAG: alpha-N-acetylglucosaminidase [Bacteroidales bacterium]
MKHIFILVIYLTISCIAKASPITHLLERIDKGASEKFKIEVVQSGNDFFELDQEGDKVVIRGNNYVSIATGINWYLKYHAGIHLSWNGMSAVLPTKLPPVKQKERHDTTSKYRYYLNYCTYSYSMAFWNWERWEKEIDWMALHGINTPLTITGMETVWYNVLKKSGYTQEEINNFISGSGFMAWWFMNNLEGWGGPNPESWYKQQSQLTRKILNRVRELGIKPVFPGYSGMVPSDAGKKLGLDVEDPGLWCGFKRPGFLQPTDPKFEQIATLYYREMKKLFGDAEFYSMDPFHEGGNTNGVDLAAAGRAIMKTMKQTNPNAIWVIQAWQANPRNEMTDSLNQGDMLILDLYSENKPMWGDENSEWYRKQGYKQHDWLYCMLLNFGGNVGMFGRMDKVINGYYKAQNHPNGKTMKGVGLTPEGIANNPVMYELLTELPWRTKPFTKEEWVKDYARARYGTEDAKLTEAWEIMANTAYNCHSEQEGETESVFCARPKEDIHSISTWGTSKIYYNVEDFRKAAECMLSVANKYRGNNNFEYDLVDVVRQTLSDRGNILQKDITTAYREKDKDKFSKLSKKFLDLILLQDHLLSSRSEFMLGTWLQQAKEKGKVKKEKQLYEWNARTLITVWGNREAAEVGGLHDYSNREWSGMLKDFYYPRWKTWFNTMQNRIDGIEEEEEEEEETDWYTIEEAWTRKRNVFPSHPNADPIDTAIEVYKTVFGK